MPHMSPLSWFYLWCFTVTMMAIFSIKTTFKNHHL